MAGPSFVRVTQQVLNVTVPTGSQTVSVAVRREEDTATGVNVGIEGVYRVGSRLGLALRARYVRASIDIAGADEARAGGIQGGVGVRVRF